MNASVSKTKSDWVGWIEQGEILPHFQPIVSLQNKDVFGYEVLGRIQTTEGNILSLGEFFQAKVFSKSNRENLHFRSYQKRINKQILEKALQFFKNNSEPESKLFINLSPVELWHYYKFIEYYDVLPPLFEELANISVDHKRIVIEITEDYVESNLELLKPVISVYKGFGFLIAIDDLGSKASNLDRVAIFRPDIIKVDMHYLRKSLADRGYKEILSSLSRLGEKLGISLLYEGVETMEEMNQALHFGARYIQGYFFDQALNYFPEKGKYSESLHSVHRNFESKFNSNTTQIGFLENDVNRKIQKVISKIQFDGFQVLNHLQLFSMDSDFFRIYVINSIGDQVSPTYLRKRNNEIEIRVESNNWSWRPFFSNHLVQSKKLNKSWVLSEPYRDLHEDIMVETISVNIGFKFILLIDSYLKGNI